MRRPPKKARRAAGTIPQVYRRVVIEIMGEDSVRVMRYAEIIQTYAEGLAKTSSALAACSGESPVFIEALPPESLKVVAVEARTEERAG